MDTLTDIPPEITGPDGAVRPLLRIVYSPAAGAVDMRLPLMPELVIGRDPGRGGITVADPRVSGRHLRIRSEEGRVRFEDLGSKNGTFHNGAQVTKGTLSEGDLIRVGATLLVCTRRGPEGRVEDPNLGLVGDAPGFREAVLHALKGAGSALPVLLLGETGSGKDVVARAIHGRSGRGGPFVAVNCAAIPEELADAALFGHEKGAFTGAAHHRRGYVREASGGTLFLDEVGDLPAEIQPRLLRLIEQGEVMPVGASRASRVDVRVVAATNVDLESAVEGGRFRADLFARLTAWPVRLPALRDRREDVLRLARWFAGARTGRRDEDPTRLWEPGLAEALVLHAWPFNVRELRQLVERLLVGGEPPFSVADAPEPIRDAVRAARSRQALGRARQTALGLGGTLGDAEAPAIRPSREDLVAALEAHAHNVSATARHFRRARKQIYRWIRHYGIELPGER